MYYKKSNPTSNAENSASSNVNTQFYPSQSVQSNPTSNAENSASSNVNTTQLYPSQSVQEESCIINGVDLTRL